MKGVLIGITIFLVVILVAIGGFKLYDYIGAAEFYNNSEAVFNTPGVTDSNFVPQGMTYIEERETFIFSGYMGKPIIGKLTGDVSSRIYVRNSNGDVTYTRLLKADGTAYTGHAGGVDYFGDYIYVADEDERSFVVFSAEDILSGKEETKMLGMVKTYNASAHCYVFSDDNGEKYILAGSYHKDGTVYLTPSHEKITTPTGDKNTSIMTVFKLDENAEFGIDPIPVAVISAREMIQGICITPDGKMVLSTSWGFSRSQLFFYDLSKVQCTEGYNFQGVVTYADKGEETFEFSNIPLYYLDSSCLVDTVKAPPMSEELVCLDGRIIVFCESACNKCAFGKLTTGYKIYGFEYNK